MVCPGSFLSPMMLTIRRGWRTVGMVGVDCLNFSNVDTIKRIGVGLLMRVGGHSALAPPKALNTKDTP